MLQKNENLGYAERCLKIFVNYYEDWRHRCIEGSLQYDLFGKDAPYSYGYTSLTGKFVYSLPRI